MITKTSKLGVASVLAGVLLAVGGCTDKSSPDRIDQRSVERWNYLIARQAEKAYDYLTPGFKQTVDREAYAASMNGRPVQWKTAKFAGKTCEAEHCKVSIDVTYSIKLPGGAVGESTSTQSENWLLVDGEWFFLPSN